MWGSVGREEVSKGEMTVKGIKTGLNSKTWLQMGSTITRLVGKENQCGEWTEKVR